MLGENIKQYRKAMGLSQEELAIKLNVVRQTVSKWERGLSVPDSDLLVSLSEALDTPVSTLLDETVALPETDDIHAISKKLEVINLQLARRRAFTRSALTWFFVLLAAGVVIVFAISIALNSPYLAWDLSDPEIAVVSTIYHAFEWVFIRIAPIILLCAAGGILLTRKSS